MWPKLFFENNEVSIRAIAGRPISTWEEDVILVLGCQPFLSAFKLKKASNFPGSRWPQGDILESVEWGLI